MRANNILQMLFCSILFLTSGLLSAADAPEEVYKKFHDAMLKGDLDAMLQLSPESMRAELADSPPEQNAAMIAMMGKLLPKTISILGLVPGADANAATLHASGMGTSLLGGQEEKQYGTIAMVMEGGNWKVGKSSWDNKPPKGLPKSSGSAPPAAAVSAAPPVPATAVAPAASAAPETPAATPPAAAAAPVAVAPAPPKPPEKKKPVCIIKQVMSNAEIAACREAASEP